MLALWVVQMLRVISQMMSSMLCVGGHVEQVAGFCRWLQAKKCSTGVRNLERDAFVEKLIYKDTCLKLGSSFCKLLG